MTQDQAAHLPTYSPKSSILCVADRTDTSMARICPHHLYSSSVYNKIHFPYTRSYRHPRWWFSGRGESPHRR